MQDCIIKTGLKIWKDTINILNGFTTEGFQDKIFILFTSLNNVFQVCTQVQ
jgi:hypothetical protein